MAKIKLLAVEQHPYGVVKRYQHGEYGLMPVVIRWGSADGGSADTIYMGPAFWEMQQWNLRRRGIDPNPYSSARRAQQQPKPKRKRSSNKKPAKPTRAPPPTCDLSDLPPAA